MTRETCERCGATWPTSMEERWPSLKNCPAHLKDDSVSIEAYEEVVRERDRYRGALTEIRERGVLSRHRHEGCHMTAVAALANPEGKAEDATD